MTRAPLRRACPLCDSPRSEAIGRLCSEAICANNYQAADVDRLRLNRAEEWEICACLDCGFVFAGRVPDAEFLDRLYDEGLDLEADRQHNLAWQVFREHLAAWHALVEARSRKRSVPAGPVRVLDFGAGWGDFALLVQCRQVRAIGFEPSRVRREFMQSQGLVTAGSWSELETLAPFDFICCNQVLEHVPRPVETLRGLGRLLAPEGLLYLAVPDYSPERAQQELAIAQRGEPWPVTLNPWEHLSYFSPATFRRTIARAGLEVDHWPELAPDLRHLAHAAPAGSCLLVPEGTETARVANVGNSGEVWVQRVRNRAGAFVPWSETRVEGPHSVAPGGERVLLPGAALHLPQFDAVGGGVEIGFAANPYSGTAELRAGDWRAQLRLFAPAPRSHNVFLLCEGAAPAPEWTCAVLRRPPP